MKQNRLKSPVFWSTIAALVLDVLVALGVIGAVWSDAITGVVTAALSALVTFGILNNPTDKTNF